MNKKDWVPLSGELRRFPGKALIFDAEIVFMSKPMVTAGVK